MIGWYLYYTTAHWKWRWNREKERISEIDSQKHAIRSTIFETENMIWICGASMGKNEKGSLFFYFIFFLFFSIFYLSDFALFNIFIYDAINIYIFFLLSIFFFPILCTYILVLLTRKLQSTLIIKNKNYPLIHQQYYKYNQFYSSFFFFFYNLLW